MISHRARNRLATVLLPLGLWACGSFEEPADFRFLNVEPESIDPGRCSDQPGGRIVMNLFEGLTVRAQATLEVQPGIARRVERSADGLRYTFILRPSRWSDGSPLTSEDFRYAWTRLLDPVTASQYANLLYPVRNAEAFNLGEITDPTQLGLSCPDDSTFVVELHSPTAYFLDLCAYYPLCPVPREIVETHGDVWTRPANIVSNGPYVLEQWQINRRIRLRRNPLFWNVENVDLEIVDATGADYINGNFNRYMAGDLDWVDSTGIPFAVVDQLHGRPDLHIGPFLNVYFYRFNTTVEPLDDARVRRALYHAVDSRSICVNVLRAGQEPAHSLVPPGLPGYEEVQLDGYQPERARQLMAEAGYPGGSGFPELTLLFNTSEQHKQIAEVVQQQWKAELGIDVSLQNQEWKVFLANTRGLEYEISRGGWIGDYLDPNTFLDIFLSTSGNNRTGFASERYDALIAEAASELDPERRMAILRECERIVTAEECIILPIYYYVATNLFDAERFEGLTPNLLNTIDLRYVRRRRAS